MLYLAERKRPEQSRVSRIIKETIVEQIEIIEHTKTAYRWLASGKALRIPYDYVHERLALGRARRVTS